MIKYFECGIDFGDSNSYMAVPDCEQGFTVIENRTDNLAFTPIAISFNRKGRMLVGLRAYNSLLEDSISGLLRWMGIKKEIVFSTTDIRKTPIELAAEILKRQRNDAEVFLGHAINSAIITIPSSFKVAQCEDIIKAGNLAGFKYIGLIQKPVAVAIAFGAKPDSKDKHWMVYDYGGRSLDVAIISTTNNRLIVENSEGDNYFGGIDFDQLMYKKIIVKGLMNEGYVVDELLDETTSSGRLRIHLMICLLLWK